MFLWTLFASSCGLAWLADGLARIADHPSRRLDELLPWNWTSAGQPQIAA